MGANNSSLTPLNCILKNWDRFDPQGLKKTHLVFLCDTAWPRYPLEDGERWPVGGSLKYNTVLQLDRFCKEQGKWVEVRRRQWHPTPVLFPGKSHGRRSLVGCSPWGREELDTTERLHFHFHVLEKEMATHSSVLAWRVPGMGKAGGLPSLGSHRVRHD